ncbi:MAG: LuxR C-terminal-related transcriptional regulator [Desulfobacterales bacterium]|nr:LuxR C-terminal-related transcriptional regulator [Desulfobacterales bacterium]
MKLRIGYHSLGACADGPVRQAGREGVFLVGAGFLFEENIGPLLPYINAVAERSELYDRPPMVRFVYKGVACAVYPDRCIASPLESRDHVRAFADDLIAYLSDIYSRREEIVPKPQVFKPGAVPQILKLLPGTNCGECGVKTCMAFAALLARQQVSPDQCPHMTRPLSQTYPVLDADGCQISQVTLHIDGRNGAADDPPTETSTDPSIRPQPDEIPAVKPVRDPETGILPEPLTNRELQVLSLMGEGQTNPEISRVLGISPHTVKSHVIHIFNKLGVNHRTQAVVWAARNGVI